jgi:hypothetical protein
VKAALKVTQKFYTAKAQQQRADQRRAERRIEVAVHLIQGALVKGTFDPPSADVLLDLLGKAEQDIQNALP